MRLIISVPAIAVLLVISMGLAYYLIYLEAAGKIERLPEGSRYAADKCYVATVAKLCDGLEKVIASYRTSTDAHKKRVYALWSRK